jgi:alkanesulfonate monooxygenase SsuD/methylene tetrahydromethanopterin reductase-like flavin-dependent oxidoreductase (luciferase family)
VQWRAVLAGTCEAVGRDPATLRFSAMVGFLVGRDAQQLPARRGRLAVDRGKQRDETWVTGLPEQAWSSCARCAMRGCSG